MDFDSYKQGYKAGIKFVEEALDDIKKADSIMIEQIDRCSNIKEELNSKKEEK